MFTRPDGIKVTLTGDKTINSWQVCTGNEIGEKARQAGVAVEPMTAYADAFRTGKDLVVLEPGDDYTTVVTFHRTNLKNRIAKPDAHRHMDTRVASRRAHVA